jgi:chromosome segregation ATPase
MPDAFDFEDRLNTVGGAMPPDEPREPFDPTAQHSARQQESLASLKAMLAQIEERMKQHNEEARQREQETLQRQHDPLARLDTLRAQEEERRQQDAARQESAERARQDAAREAQARQTTVTQARSITERETHPSWIHAAYADLAQRLARAETLLEELGDSMSLLHTKMETIIGQLAIHERLDRGERP